MLELRSEFLCTLTGRVAPARDFGTVGYGQRRFLGAVRGSFEGLRLRGELLPDGGDWLLTRPDGVQEIDVRLTLCTDDGALIYVRYGGVRHAEPEVMARMARGEQVDASEVYFRITPRFETGHSNYQWLNNIVAVGVGERLSPDAEPDTIGIRYAL